MAQLELALTAASTITTGIVDTSYQFETKTPTTTTNLYKQRPQRECRQRKRPYDPSEIDQLSQRQIKRTKSNIENERLSKLTDENPTNTNSYLFIKQATVYENNHHNSNELTNDGSGEIIDNPLNYDEQTRDSVSSEIQSDVEDIPLPTIHNNEQLSSYPRHLRKQIKRFHYLYDHGLQKPIEPTRIPEVKNDEGDDNNNYLITKWKLQNTFNRLDLFKEGYSVLSNEQFPFYSLCYMVSTINKKRFIVDINSKC
ncbi:unnamed protein product [Didymodactylos carnosus]|uniref:Uncharacterized protein n=1 Tax=Didymodactylos carnosus TaxID=1234261 RepID=A0A8S2V286_9BILA|nr:unnamed protein product [Didymodactylos carnosus]CAF4373241.1 unnamed protein product [Didymodactylos carnosus]